MNNVKLKTSWQKILENEFKKPYFTDLMSFINNEYRTKKVCPRKDDIFRCFNFFDFENTTLVILGQDPYHVPQMADGLSFSTRLNIKPKSLMNMFNELKTDLNITRTNCDLSDIAKQNVLLLNTCLTVLENKPLSHANKGWEIFTDNIIKEIDSNLRNVIFLLMGNNAISKEALIINNKQFIIKTSHPSPFSYHISFKNSKVFSKINNLLLSMNKSIIFW